MPFLHVFSKFGVPETVGDAFSKVSILYHIFVLQYEITGFEGPNILDIPGVAGAVLQTPL